jgi:hypothetical protein
MENTSLTYIPVQIFVAVTFGLAVLALVVWARREWIDLDPVER